MAQVILSNVGQAIGGPIGGTIGSTIGRMLDNRLVASLQPARQRGPRLEALNLSSSAEGAPKPIVLGRARVAGQLIWAARFLEKRRESSGGKGGQKTLEYDYSLSFAMALGEGPIDGIGRVWADGQLMDTSGVAMRLHRGTETQAPDSLIEAVEGQAPAYRGTAYVVFEDLPLGPFGNRVPQLSFEVFCRVRGEPGLEDLLEGVCLIPGAGEFCLATETVMRREGLTRASAENVNHSQGVSDLVVSLDQLIAQVPNLKRVSLVVGWFGSSVRAGECEVRPGVENRSKRTEPQAWSVAGQTRAEAYLVSQLDDGQGGLVPAYGGTPSDDSVRQAIRAMKARGLEVTLYPFVFMDCEGYPWRGRITADDGEAASAQVAQLFGEADGWGLRRQALHYARIVAEEGADGLLIGSEMRGLTWSRDEAGGFPAVARFRQLAAECRAIVGPGVKLSYAADWSEYFGRQAGGEAWYHLDPLWADPNIDYVGIDWYAPMGDWREGDWRLGGGGLDRDAGYQGPTDPAYLAAQVAGGEGFDWYYASDADRAAQRRTPIRDTAHGEDWVFRYKDLKAWWSNLHHDRPGGVRAASPTAWVPQMKPIRLTEFGCAAVDRGCNAPNLFQDPKSTENGLPPFSTGARDDRIQRRTAEAILKHYLDAGNNPVSGVYGGPMLAAADAWCWDARPYPAFPSRGDLWADCPAWREGHWLNGRMVGDCEGLITALLRLGGLVDDEFDVAALEGPVSGYVIDRPMRLREALEPLVVAMGARVAERGGRITVRGDEPAVMRLEAGRLALPERGASLVAERRLALRPQAVRVRHVDEASDYQTGAVVVRNPAGGEAGGLDVDLPVLCDAELAGTVAHRALAEHEGQSETLTAMLGPLEALELEPGDVVRVEGHDGEWRVERLDWAEQPTAKLEPVVRLWPGRTETDWRPGTPPVSLGRPFVRLVEVRLDEDEADHRPLAVVAAEPWVPMAVHGGAMVDDLELRARVEQPATVGQLVEPLAPGVIGRWDWANAVVLSVEGRAPQSRSAASVLGGRNRLIVETGAGWELIQFRRADLLGSGLWRLSGLLRGQAGTEAESRAGAQVGASVVLVDEALPRVEMKEAERNLPRLWRVGPAGLPPGGAGFAELDHVWTGRSAQPWRPAHLRLATETPDWTLAWVARSWQGADVWEGEPVAMEPMRFRLRVMEAETERRQWEVEGAGAIYSQAQRLVDFPQGPSPQAEIRLAQWGQAWGWGAEATVKLI